MLLLFVAAETLAACGKLGPQCSLTEKRSAHGDVEAADRDGIRRDMDAVQTGKPVCAGLFPLRVAQKGKELVVPFVWEGDHARGVVDSWSASPKARLDTKSVVVGLASYRQLWKQWYPGKPFEGVIDIELDPDLEAKRGASVLVAAALAGYPTEHVRAGAESIDATWWVPGSIKPPPTVLVVTPVLAGFVFHFEGAACNRPKPLRAAMSSADLPDAVTGVCAGTAPCADAITLEVETSGKLGAVLRTLGALLSAPPFAAKHPLFALRDVLPDERSSDYEVLRCPGP